MGTGSILMYMSRQDKKIISGWLDLLKGFVPPGSIIELPVLSGSMAPLIMPGSTVAIRACSGNDARRGDIIVFKEGNSLTIHRLLVRIPLGNNSLIYQKGDANRFGNWIRSSLIVGIVDSVRNVSGETSTLSHKAGKRASLGQLGCTFLNMALHYPRIIKQWLRK